MKIFLDPGHGGSNIGNVNDVLKIKESNINLDIAKKIGYLLDLSKKEVAYSRESDINISLDDRIRKANLWNANYFVSIHTNGSTNPMNSGTETLFFKHGTTAEQFAATVHEQLLFFAHRKDLGMHAENLAVLRLTKMPAILVETAYITSTEEASLLSKEDFRQKCAEGIANGVNLFCKM